LIVYGDIMKLIKNNLLKKSPYEKYKSYIFQKRLLILSIMILIVNVILIFIYYNYQWFVISRFNSGDIPTWLAAVGSTGTLGFAVYQLYKTSKDRKKERIEQQARKIFAYFVPAETSYHAFAMLYNLSDSPVYNVVITQVTVHGVSPSDGKTKWNNGSSKLGEYISVLTPGKFQTVNDFDLDPGMSRRYGIEIAFRDSEEQSWIIDGHGHLHAIKVDPLIYYDVSIPRPSSAIIEIK
jgi:flagellar basal body-associated protein FliL